MGELRWILLTVGVAIVVYVYWRGRREQRRRARNTETRIDPIVRSGHLEPEQDRDARREPLLGDLGKTARERLPESDTRAEVIPPVWSAEIPSATRASTVVPGLRHASAEEKPPRQPPANKIVALRIVRREGQRIPGADLIAVLGREGLEYGEHKIFHRYAESVERAARGAIFSVANMVEPGELDPDLAGGMELPGATIFMVLPGTRAGVSALADMLSTARRIAVAVDAEVLDPNGSTMTRQTADHLRDEVIAFEHRHRNDNRATTVGQ